jgi:hypothetical protein
MRRFPVKYRRRDDRLVPPACGRRYSACRRRGAEAITAMLAVAALAPIAVAVGLPETAGRTSEEISPEG